MFDCLRHLVTRDISLSLSLEEEVATVDVGAHVREAFSGDLLT